MLALIANDPRIRHKAHEWLDVYINPDGKMLDYDAVSNLRIHAALAVRGAQLCLEHRCDEHISITYIAPLHLQGMCHSPGRFTAQLRDSPALWGISIGPGAGFSRSSVNAAQWPLSDCTRTLLTTGELWTSAKAWERPGLSPLRTTIKYSSEAVSRRMVLVRGQTGVSAA